MYKTLLLLALFNGFLFGQLNAQKNSKKETKEERKARINALAKQAEEGATIFNKQLVYGLIANVDGFGVFIEKATLKSPRVAVLYHISISNRTHPKEERTSAVAQSGPFVIQTNPFVFGKVNNFYQASFLYGQQHVIGNKANKNGIEVQGILKAGLTLGMLRPYYTKVDFSPTAGAGTDIRNVKYEKSDANTQTKLLDPDRIVSGTGSKYGWTDMQINPGLKAHTGLRFEFGRQADRVTAVELIMQAEFYSKKVTQMVQSKPKNFYFSSGIAIMMGNRK
jgi:hypothetical protein